MRNEIMSKDQEVSFLQRLYTK